MWVLYISYSKSYFDKIVTFNQAGNLLIDQEEKLLHLYSDIYYSTISSTESWKNQISSFYLRQ